LDNHAGAFSTTGFNILSATFIVSFTVGTSKSHHKFACDGSRDHAILSRMAFGVVSIDLISVVFLVISDFFSVAGNFSLYIFISFILASSIV
jgi:hypothetical protein